MKPVETIAWIVLAEYPYPTTSPPREGGLPRIELIDRCHYDACLAAHARALGRFSGPFRSRREIREYPPEVQALVASMLQRAEDDKGRADQRAGMAQAIQEVIDLRVLKELEVTDRYQVTEERPADPPPAQG